MPPSSSRPSPHIPSALYPITALAFFSTSSGLFLFAGEDANVGVYDVATGARLRVVPVLRTQPVHGIVVDESGVVVWGNNAVVRLDGAVVEGWVAGGEENGKARDRVEGEDKNRVEGEDKNRVEGEDKNRVEDENNGKVRDRVEGKGSNKAKGRVEDIGEGLAHDWIHIVQMSPHDTTTGILITAHNEAVVVKKCPHSKGGLEITKNVASPSRPMLYSASVQWTSPTSVLIAAGTVFGEIHVWTCTVADALSVHMRCVLSGHEGSIFGVRLHETSAGDMLLASCSDDRTVRIWDVSDKSTNQWTDNGVLSAPRETGFASGLAVCAERQLAIAMGHISRIWSVRFINDATVCSFGEDCAAITWDLGLGADPLTGRRVGTLIRREARTAHEGRHIWASASQGGLLATGGADGRVVLADTTETSVLFSDVSRQRFRQFEFVGQDELFAATRMGQILHGSIIKDSIEWSECALDGTLQKILAMGGTTVVKRVADGVAVIGTSGGHVLLARKEGGGVKLMCTLAGTICDIFPLEASWEKQDGQHKVDVLVSLAADRVPVLVSLDLDLCHCTMEEEKITVLDSRTIITTASYVGPYLIIGSRQGFLDLLLRPDPDTAHWALVSQTRESDESITSIVPLGGLRFCTTSRDGKYRVHEISSSAVVVQTLHQETPSLGPYLDSAWLSGEGHVIIAGFRNGTVVLHNHTTREDIATADCSGPHHAFSLTKSGSTPRIAFSRASRLHIHTQTRPPQRIIRPGTGGREIRAVDATTLEGVKYVAVGSEDNIVRIYQAVHEGPVLRCVAVLKKHSSGLQQVRWCVGPDGEVWLFTSSGHEELFVWRVTPLGVGVGVVFEAALGDVSRDRDLRITDFDVSVGNSPLEDVSLGSKGVIHLSIARSDSSFATYEYSPTSRVFATLVVVGRYTGACLTHIVHLDSGVLTAATDGFLSIWGHPSLDSSTRSSVDSSTHTTRRPSTATDSPAYVLSKNMRVHGGSIKGLAVLSRSASEIVVATGGDDNALGLTVVRTSASTSASASASAFGQGPIASRSMVIKTAHAASINALVSLGEGWVVSCSNDQRVRWWRWDQEDTNINEGTGINKDVSMKGDTNINVGTLVLEREERSGVADVGGVCLLGRGVLVGGVGVEVWTERTKDKRQKR